MKSRLSPVPKRVLNHLTVAIVAAAILVGIGLGIGLSSAVVANPNNLASSQFVDAKAPDAPLCAQYGSSAVTVDTRLFMTFNPFSVFISRPKMQPGCVLRPSDWSVLEQKQLVSAAQERECKNSMNTFGFTGSLEQAPQIDCVYQNDAIGNQFLTQAGITQHPKTD